MRRDANGTFSRRPIKVADINVQTVGLSVFVPLISAVSRQIHGHNGPTVNVRARDGRLSQYWTRWFCVAARDASLTCRTCAGMRARMASVSARSYRAGRRLGDVFRRISRVRKFQWLSRCTFAEFWSLVRRARLRKVARLDAFLGVLVLVDSSWASLATVGFCK